jgi:protein TonB
MQHFPLHSRWRWLPALLAFIACGSSSAQTPACTAADRTSIVSASNLRRTRIVNAAYPVIARENKVEGWVEVAFTIQPDGSVTDLAIQNANPAGVFEESVITAVAQWRYEPVLCDGQPVHQRAMIRVKFSL